jgi:hypothetical protein
MAMAAASIMEPSRVSGGDWRAAATTATESESSNVASGETASIKNCRLPRTLRQGKC